MPKSWPKTTKKHIKKFNLDGECTLTYTLGMKEKTIYKCSDCEYQTPKWIGKCPNCNSWSSFKEEIIKREKKLNRKTEIIRVESGLGASGIPHVGSMGDAVRAFGVKKALVDRGYKAELITYADDMDGLRKIPEGLPETLKKYLGFPVSEIPDPFNTHDSYGEHMSSMLKNALDLVEIEYTHESGTKAYKNGVLNSQIIKILENSKLIGEKISDMLGQETPYRRNTPLFYIYDDGTVEKRIVIE